MTAEMKLILLLLLLSLSGNALAEGVRCPAYEREDWKHWVDADRDCQNTRHEVLIAESQTSVKFKTSKECRVVTGSWIDPYSGKTITDATKLDIDHLVPLLEAHQSGGHAWDAYKRQEYANDLSDPNTLIAVDRSLNRQKGADDPAEWLPPNEAYLAEYARAWVSVKIKWGLTADPAEIAALTAVLGVGAEMPIAGEECAGGAKNPFSAPLPVASVDCQAKRYCTQMRTCEEAQAYLTQCEIKSLDRDGDGVPCEALCD